jgi:hypothetical protein
MHGTRNVKKNRDGRMFSGHVASYVEGRVYKLATLSKLYLSRRQLFYALQAGGFSDGQRYIK